MFVPLLIDSVRLLHLLCVVVGFGAAFLADYSVFRRLHRPVTRHLIEQLSVLHNVVWAGLIGMWITGLALIFIRTGFVVEAFSPKLFTKLGVVTVLTANAVLIGRLAMPMLRDAYGQAPLDLPLMQKLRGAWLASLSTVSWVLALALGSSKVLAASGWGMFACLVPCGYVVGLLGATLLVLGLHWLEQNNAHHGEAMQAG